jgi:thioredoxin 1
MAPAYDALSTKHEADGIHFGKVDVDDNGDAAATYGIQAVPTFITVSGGTIIDRFSGADANQLDDLIAKLKLAEK